MKKAILILFPFFLFFCSSAKEQGGNPLVLLALPSLQQSVTTSGLCKTTQSGNVYTTTANAREYYNSTYCSLSKSGISTKKTENWELSFKRFKVGTNSGTNGSGKSGSCDTGSTNFSSVTKTSCTSFTKDADVSYQTNTGSGLETQTESGNSVLKDWYNYNTTTHALTTKNKVYLIKSADEKSIFKVKFLDYYSQAGTSGYVKFQWQRL